MLPYYKRLAWIKVTQSGLSTYLSLPQKSSGSLRMDVKFALHSNNGDGRILFGSSDQFRMFRFNGMFYWDYQGDRTVGGEFNLDTIYNLSLGDFFINDIEHYKNITYQRSKRDNFWTDNENLYWHLGNSMTIYSTKIYDFNADRTALILKMDFVPCLNTQTSQIGLYDLINDVFCMPANYEQNKEYFTYEELKEGNLTEVYLNNNTYNPSNFFIKKNGNNIIPSQLYLNDFTLNVRNESVELIGDNSWSKWWDYDRTYSFKTLDNKLTIKNSGSYGDNAATFGTDSPIDITGYKYIDFYVKPISSSITWNEADRFPMIRVGLTQTKNTSSDSWSECGIDANGVPMWGISNSNTFYSWKIRVPIGNRTGLYYPEIRIHCKYTMQVTFEVSSIQLCYQ